jgi:hypothetical protein
LGASTDDGQQTHARFLEYCLPAKIESDDAAFWRKVTIRPGEQVVVRLDKNGERASRAGREVGDHRALSHQDHIKRPASPGQRIVLYANRCEGYAPLGKLATHHRPRFPGLLIAAISITQLFDHKPTSRPALVQDGLDTNVDTLH